MKRQLICLLTICLLLTCFTACGQQKVTVTQTNTPPVTEDVVSVEQQSTEEQNKEQPEKESQEQQQAVEKEDKTTVVDKDKSEKTQTTANEKDSNKSSKKQNTEIENIHADIRIERPNFTSYQGYEQWIKTGSGYYEEDRNRVLQNAATPQSTVYYRPSTAWTNYAVLDNFEVEYGGEFGAWYTIDGEPRVLLSIGHVDGILYKLAKQAYENGSQWEYCYEDLKSGIVYYWEDSCTNMDDDIYVHWSQFGRTHSARFVGYTEEEVEELIPLLKLEQVTINLNNDHVVQ